jgi:hypothetical protein
MPERKEVKFPIPEGSRSGICRGCGAKVIWIVTKAGRNMPVDSDGTSHFATCPQAKQFRKRKE